MSNGKSEAQTVCVLVATALCCSRPRVLQHVGYYTVVRWPGRVCVVAPGMRTVQCVCVR